MVADDTAVVPTNAKWTDALPDSDHVNFLRQADFGSTKLGPILDWPLSLRNYVYMVFTDSRAACIYWGERKIAMYEIFCHRLPHIEVGCVVYRIHPRNPAGRTGRSLSSLLRRSYFNL